MSSDKASVLPKASRRNILIASLSGCAAAGAIGGVHLLNPARARARDASDWPEWALSGEAYRARIADQRAKAVSVRSFGARLDGVTDDTEALKRAYDSGASAVSIDGAMLLTRPLKISRGFALLGIGNGPHIVWAGSGQRAALMIAPANEKDPMAFVRDVTVGGIVAMNKAPTRPSPLLVSAINVRGLLIAECRTDAMGLAAVTHQRIASGAYQRKKGSRDTDPAVDAGFSPTSLDDLNEDIVCLDNHVDNKVYQSAVLRFEMARRVIVAGNTGKFAKVSWWGGGAKAKQGGQPQFLRRVRDVYIADNTLSGSNGNIYGNNGQNVVVARNTVSDALDTAIDFEGCMDCHAYDNTVRNAGNFGLSTFYVARNIVFERNIVEQDGSAATLPQRFGSKPIGSARGIALVALRSAGFAKSDAISVRFANNRFVYSAPEGIGICLPSYFDTVEFTDNTLVNVSADWRYSFSRKLVIRGNRMVFDRPALTPATLLAGSAREGAIADNRVEVGATMPAGSVGIGYEISPMVQKVGIRSNTITGSGAGQLPLVLVNAGKVNAGKAAQPTVHAKRFQNRLDIAGNRVATIEADGNIAEALDGAIASHDNALSLPDYPVRNRPVDRANAKSKRLKDGAKRNSAGLVDDDTDDRNLTEE